MQNLGSGKLNIIVAVYGLKIVTDEISGFIIDGYPQTFSLTVNNYTIKEDGWRGQQKSLTVLYNYDGGELNVATAKEGDILNINPAHIRKQKFPENHFNINGLSVLAATYGPDDVTYKVRNMISPYNTLSFRADNEIFGDSWYGVPKTLVVILGNDDEVRSVEIFTEREICYIDLNDAVPAI